MELSHSTLYVGEKGEVYRQRGQMGYFSLSQISLQGDRIVEEMIYESPMEGGITRKMTMRSIKQLRLIWKPMAQP